MQIDDALVAKLASLSKLSLSPENQRDMKHELQRMLDFVDVLRQVDTEGVAPLIHMTEATASLREDTATPTLNRDALMQQAPESAPPFFTVPKVVDKG